MPSLSPLNISCCWGFLSLVKKLTSVLAGAGLMEHELALALRIASQNGHDKVVEHLIQIPQLPSSAIGPSITAAAEGGHENVVLQLLKIVSDTFDLERPNSLLCMSAGNGHLEVVEYLTNTLNLEYEDSIFEDSFDRKSLTPVHYASSRGHANIVQFLGKERAFRANHKDYSISPLQLAVGNGHSKVAEKLLEFGFNPEREQPSVLFLAAKIGHKTIIEKLIQKVPSLDVRDEFGQTALHVSCSHNFVNISKMLIDKSADLDLQDEEKNTALHLAAKNGTIPTIELLLEKGARVLEKNSNGDTPLHLTLSGEEEAAAILLLERSCGQKEKTDDQTTEIILGSLSNSGDTPLMLALENNMRKVAMRILVVSKEHPALFFQITRPEVLKKSAEKGYSELVKFILDAESSPAPKAKGKKTKNQSSRFVDARITIESRELEEQRQLLLRLSTRNRDSENREEHYRYPRERADELIRRR